MESETKIKSFHIHKNQDQPRKKRHQENEETRAKNLKNLIDLVPSDIFEFQFFCGDKEKDKIDVDYNQVNSSIQIMENSKKGFAADIEKFPKYDPTINQKINLQTVKNRILQINPNYPVSEINHLFPGKNEINAKDLTSILQTNQIKDFDPLQEAMSFFQDDQNGNLSLSKLQNMMSQLGYGELDKKDVEILKECLDADKDGKISSRDLMEIFNKDTFEFIKQSYNKREFK